LRSGHYAADPMIRGERSIDIGARPEAVYAIASDLERYPEWQDFLQKVSVRERDPAGQATVVEAEADAKVVALKLVLRATREEPRRVAWRSEGGDVKALNGAFDLAAAGDGRTRATFGLEVDPGFKLGLLLRGSVADRLRDRVLDGMLDGLRRRAESAG
jgi:ribosome-associated toxin RatA of RatAB toxin-antitoxin module